MLFTEEQLRIDMNPFTILDQAVYLTEDESIIQPKMIPIIENKRIGRNVIGYKELFSIGQNYGIGLEEALNMVAASCNINPSHIVVSIDEADIIEDVSIIENAIPYVVVPISENDCESVYTKMILSRLLEEDVFDEELCVHLLTEETYEDITKKLNILSDQRDHDGKPFTKEEKKEWKHLMRRVHPDLHRDKNEASLNTINLVNEFISRMGGIKTNSGPSNKTNSGPSNKTNQGNRNWPSGNNKWSNSLAYLKSMTKAIAVPYIGMTLGVNGAMIAYAYKNRPRSFIAKRIAALRSIYQRMLYDAETHPEKIGIIKKAAAVILNLIDKLLSVLQRAADGRLTGYAPPTKMFNRFS